jgi:hypothetical protein
MTTQQAEIKALLRQAANGARAAREGLLGCHRQAKLSPARHPPMLPQHVLQATRRD